MNNHFNRQYVNLASARLGSEVIYVTDDWFAEANRMLQPDDPVWKADIYDDNGKWMDGWESRRKRTVGHDYAVVRLGMPGVIKAVDIDTSFFTGNFPPSASIEACFCEQGDPDEQTTWVPLLPSVSLKGDSHHVHEIGNDHPFTHLRLNIYPDGGVARLRVYGTPYHDWSSRSIEESVDLAASMNGGRALTCSDQHYGHISNLIAPGRALNMGDGWETARRRTPGYDWVVLALGHPGTINEILIDTQHFKGNYPESCSIQAAQITGGTDEQIATQSLFWQELLPSQKLQMDHEHRYAAELNDVGIVTHVRVNIFPDGGLSRIRLYGKIEAE